MKTDGLRAIALALGASCVLTSCGPQQEGASISVVSPASATLPGGTSLSVAITEPTNGAVYAATGDVHVAGTAEIGAGLPVANTALVYVIDLSGSTTSGGGLSCGSTFKCEVEAAKRVNARAVQLGTIGAVGVVAFGTTAVAADVGPAGGVQLTTGPAFDANGNGTADVVDVLNSLSPAGTADGVVGLFTRYTVAGNTDLADAFVKALDVVRASGMPKATILFLTDGYDTESTAMPTVVVPQGVTIRAFALANATCQVSSRPVDLSRIVARGGPGSACTEVTNIGALPEVVASAVDPSITGVAATVDGVPFTPVALTTTVPARGPTSVGFDFVVPALGSGRHPICVTVNGEDAGGTGTVSDCVTVSVASIALAPTSATVEAGASHTVTATVAAADQAVPGVDVSFAILSGPNAGKTGAAPTDGSGHASFGYSDRACPGGLGTDLIEACFTDARGAKACARATATWVDRTPPTVSCAPGPNPAGQLSPAPPAGFRLLLATDTCDPASTIVVRDSGSGTLFGPYPSGTAVKYTVAPGAKPSARPMGGPGSAVEVHLTGKGPAEVSASDSSGNVSAFVRCAP